MADKELNPQPAEETENPYDAILQKIIDEGRITNALFLSSLVPVRYYLEQLKYFCIFGIYLGILYKKRRKSIVLPIRWTEMMTC